ncbi:DUF1622 domain-containing protein [Vulgatibacter incomptus]|uniref:DUF1622 domain-containing protein n=1 Tax=Vulgatibacter incomptus TaxID=1391653 RepID=A0A0K1PB91_9BACT|nr:DUF1622 domain-containing protein [Vulgatibacter incomptus]AKU90757.1 hypothetical protein AKJ08_1144 [Vulgatibacter incomptus]
MDFERWLLIAGQAMDAAGAVSIVVGAILALGLALARVRTAPPAEVFATFRKDFGRALLLGMEFLVGGDIIVTITTKPGISEVLSLGILVLIRTLLTFTVSLELGRMPGGKPLETSSERKP